MKLPVNLVILATGDAAIETNIRDMEKLYPNRFKLVNQTNRKWRT